MIDEYFHFNPNILYVPDSIPGSSSDTVNNKIISDDCNSQLTTHCDCKDMCIMDTCICLINSGGNNYVRNSDSHLVLNFNKVGLGESLPIYECNSQCSCSNNCNNRLVQHGPAPDLYIKDCNDTTSQHEATTKGLGLFTKSFKSKGTFICTYSGEVINKIEALHRQNINYNSGAMNYIFCLKEHSNGKVTETIIDPSKFGNIGRYINHSCECNCVIVSVRIDSPIPKLAIFSRYNIIPKSEITFNYGTNCLSSSISLPIASNRKKCLCGSKLCNQWMPYDEF